MTNDHNKSNLDIVYLGTELLRVHRNFVREHEQRRDHQRFHGNRLPPNRSFGREEKQVNHSTDNRHRCRYDQVSDTVTWIGVWRSQSPDQSDATLT